MKQKGFTLIELLAVIVILAIIALIATPMIMDVIEKSRRGAAIESVNGILDAAEKYQLNQMMDGQDIEKEIDLSSDILSYKGSKPENGKLVIGDNKKMYIIAKYGNYCIEKRFEEDSPKVVESERCNGLIELEDYKEPLLNGADPVLYSNHNTRLNSRTQEGVLVPVIIESNGTVKKANIKQEWYRYENKEWANAVILKDESIIYENNEIIPEENIESYFVWIPKYSYQLWDLGGYSSTSIMDGSKVHSIAIRFGLENTIDTQEGECTTPMNEDGTQGLSGESGNCQVGDYMTHPAFLSFHANGFWVGKFKTGYEGATTKEEAEENQADASKVIISPNVYSWRNISVGNAFQTSYEYQRDLDSHMMKNTEWGAVAYLSHSIYGMNQKMGVGTNIYITGYANETDRYNTELGHALSTTGNITGIYDMSGGTYEYVMGYNANSTIGVGGLSELNALYSDFFANNAWNAYYDKYTIGIDGTAYHTRILGDATGEMGPFSRLEFAGLSSWYTNYSILPPASIPWVLRNFYASDAYLAYTGIFSFNAHNGSPSKEMTFRIVLTP